MRVGAETEEYRRFQMWRLGWRHGATARAYAAPENADYMDGYQAGRDDSAAAMQKAIERFGVTKKELEAAVLR